MSAVEDRITAIVAEHEWRPQSAAWHEPYGACGCGHNTAQDGEWKPYDVECWATHVAERIASADDLAVIEVPVVAHKAVGVTDAEVFAGAAWRIEQGYAPGGSNTTAAVVELLRRVAKAAEGVGDRGDN